MHNKGRVTEEIVKQLKSLHQLEKVCKYPFPNSNDDIIFKLITRASYNRILDMVSVAAKNDKSLPVNDVHQKIWDDCVIWPLLTVDEKQLLPVGVIHSVVKVIQEKSGFLDVDIMDRILAPDVRTTTIQDLPYWGDLTTEEILALKSKSPYLLQKVIIDKLVFVFRPSNQNDVRIANQSEDNKLALCKSVCMWPENAPWDHLPAGYIEKLANVAFQISGWDSSATVEEL
jgi:hypothetical protein